MPGVPASAARGPLGFRGGWGGEWGWRGAASIEDQAGCPGLHRGNSMGGADGGWEEVPRGGRGPHWALNLMRDREFFLPGPLCPFIKQATRIHGLQCHS